MYSKVTYLALDITDIIVASLAMPGMLTLYSYYPLKDMLYDILSPVESPGEIEKFYEKLHTLLPITIDQDQIDIDNFIERVCLDIDVIVKQLLGNIYSTYTYTMTEWINSNSIIIQVKAINDNNSIISGFESRK